MVISGNTRLIAHLGYPTASFKAPMIYNPWFVDQQVDVKVVPMGVRPEDYAAFIPPLFTMTNIIGALVTMPHKIATCDLVQRLSPTAAIAGACNAIRREADGRLSGDMFDGDGFVLGLRRKGFNPQGRIGYRRLSRGGGSQRPDPVRYPARGGARPRRTAASALSAARYHPDAARPCRTRAGGQCHPAGDEGQRSAAAGR